MKYLVLLVLPFLFACEERYRYPCQDPNNWNKTFCQKPHCSANGTCPEDLTHYEKNKVTNGQTIVNVPEKGECK